MRALPGVHAAVSNVPDLFQAEGAARGDTRRYEVELVTGGNG